MAHNSSTRLFGKNTIMASADTPKYIGFRLIACQLIVQETRVAHRPIVAINKHGPCIDILYV